MRYQIALFLASAFPLSLCAHAQVHTWSNGAGGIWGFNTNWTPVGIPDASGESAVIALPGAYTVSLTGQMSPDSLLMSAAGATLAIGNNSRLIVQSGGIGNDGLITVNSGAGLNFTSLRFLSASPLTGSGAVRLQASANLDTAMLETEGAGNIQHTGMHRILGSGRIYAQLYNAALIHADTAGTLEIVGVVTQASDGELRADPGVISLAGTGSLSGGRITGANGGRWQSTGNPRISGVSLFVNGEVLNNSTLRVGSGGLVHSATLHVNSGTGTNFTKIVIEENATFSGSGFVNLRASAGNLDTAYIEAAPGVTLNNSAGISGAGRVYATTFNLATLRANTPGRLLEIRGEFSQASGGQIIGDNADAALGNGAIVSGGTLATFGAGRVRVTGDARVSGVHNLGALTVDNNTVLRLLAGGIENDGQITVNTTSGVNFTRVRVQESCTLAGLGSLDLNAAANLDTAYIEAEPGATLEHRSPHRIRGKGRIYTPIVGDGFIDADRPGETLEIRSLITQQAGGTINGFGGIAGLGPGSEIRGGLLNSTAGGAVRSTGIAKVGDLVNLGSLEVGNNTRIELVGTELINNGALTVNHNSGTNFTSLYTSQIFTLYGAGTLTLNASANPDTAYVEVETGGELQNAYPHTITGNGRLYGRIVNSGFIRGSSTAPDAIVRIRGTVQQESVGTIIGDVGTVGLEGGTIQGGTLQSASAPVKALSGNTSRINGVTNTGDFWVENNAQLIATNLTNDGFITINPTAGINFSSLRFDGTQEILGTGTVLLNASANPDTAYLESIAPDSVITIGPGQSVLGRGRFHGAWVSHGTLSPGTLPDTVGRFEPRGAFTFEGPSLLHLDVLNDVPGQYDTIASNALVTLGGTLELDVTTWDTLDLCASIDLITATAVAGIFDDVIIAAPTPPPGRAWRVDYQSNKVSLRLTCIADLTGDCLVDDLDFQAFVRSYNILDCADPSMPRGCPSDMNADGVVDDSDFVIWLAAYNELLCV